MELSLAFLPILFYLKTYKIDGNNKMNCYS